VARLGGGDIFGEMALVDAGTCTASVVATAHVDGWFLAFRSDARTLVTNLSLR
jgi:CRP-like cAMP-binding protein